MNIVIAGGSGLVGTALVPVLKGLGYTVDIITRYPDQPMKQDGVHYLDWDNPHAWHPAVGAAQAVINLTGSNMAGAAWSEAYKKEIRDSRVRYTQLLSEAQPRVLLQASAVGYYGEGENTVLTEATPAGSSFLAEVAKEWEEAAHGSHRCGTRVCSFRIGPILAREAGMLPALLHPPKAPFPTFKYGLGGPLGSGKQWVPWIHIDDVVGMMVAAIDDEAWGGPVNTVAPNCVTMRHLAAAIGRELGRPSYFRVPDWALRMLIGEFADALLVSQRVSAEEAERLGYTFKFPNIQEALSDLLSK